MISIIAAVSENRAIGNNNKLLYWLPNDLKRFKALTTGHTIIMGRKTFDSLPKGALPNRRNVVISRSVKELPGCEVYPSLLDAISTVQTKRSEQGDSYAHKLHRFVKEAQVFQARSDDDSAEHTSGDGTHAAQHDDQQEIVS